MSDLSEKDIDYIFQEGSKRHEFPFKESAWDNMEVLLDKQDRRRKYGYASLILSGLLIISFVGYTAHISNSNPTTDKEKQETIATSKSIAPSSVETNKSIDQSDNTTASKSNTATINTFKKDNASLAKTKIPVNNINNKVAFSTQNQKTKSSFKLNSKSINNKINNPIKLIDTNDFVNSKTVSPYLYVEMKPTENKLSIIGGNVTGELLIERLSAVPTLATLGINNVLFTNDDELPAAEVLINKPLIRFRFGLTLGKEWSGVGMSSNMSGGFRIGGDIAYRLNNRLQFSTGVIFSRKVYTTEGENYTPLPQFIWAEGAVPETVNGTTNVFEIPLELNYFFKGSSNNSFYVSGGLTTYIMDKEWYDFNYENVQHINDPNIPKFSNNIDSDKSIHYFGIGTFSVGYQKQLNKKTALQVAPYIEVPLTGIGLGQVDLISTGVQLRISFSK